MVTLKYRLKEYKVFRYLDLQLLILLTFECKHHNNNDRLSQLKYLSFHSVQVNQAREKTIVYNFQHSFLFEIV